MDGVLHIFKTLHAHEAPDDANRDWNGRWWNLWGAMDLVAVGKTKVLVAIPAQPMPFFDASVIDVTGQDAGRVGEAQAFGDLGEPVRRVRGTDGAVSSVWIGGKHQISEADFVVEVKQRYGSA